MVDSKGNASGVRGDISDINRAKLLDEASENLTENGDKSSSGPQPKKGTEKNGGGKSKSKKK